MSRFLSVSFVALAFTVFASSASAQGVVVSAAQGSLNAANSSSDGSTVTASVDGGQGSASATGNVTMLRIAASDTTHFTVGAPGASSLNDTYFSVQGGGTGPIALTFNFGTIGSWALGDPYSFSAGGQFGAFVESATGRSPQVTGGFNVVNCVPNCGGRLSNGSITTREDYYGPGAITTSPWQGGNPGSFSLASSFIGLAPDAGRLRMNLGGGVGNASVDFTLLLRSITTSGSASGLSVLFNSGQTFAVTSAVPEPTTWAMLICGFGIVGMAMRRRRSVRVTYA